MKNNRKEALAIFMEFLEVVEREKIWYAMTQESLLGAIRHGGMIPWDEKIVVSMTPESYKKLRAIEPMKLVDSSENKKIKKLSAYYVSAKRILEAPQPYIEIRIIVPTTIKKIKSVKSPFYPLKNLFKNRKNNTRNIINDLTDQRYQGYVVLHQRNISYKNDWMQVFSKKVVKKNFLGLQVNVPVEYRRYLEEWYGSEYMKAEIPDSQNIYVSPLVTLKEKF